MPPYLNQFLNFGFGCLVHILHCTVWAIFEFKKVQKNVALFLTTRKDFDYFTNFDAVSNSSMLKGKGRAEKI